LAIVVHQHHPNLVHRKFCDLGVADALTRRLFKTGVVDVEKARAIGERALGTNTRLVTFWILYGVVQTARGKFPLERAIPAGAFLLFFIALFGWSIYGSKRARKPEHVDG
jgi:hypothetical protein